MNLLSALILLCPDSAYFREPFTVHIEATEPVPPGAYAYDAWEARSGDAGIVGSGVLKPTADSFTVTINGPAMYLEAGAKIGIAIGKYDPLHRPIPQIKALPGVACAPTMKVRTPGKVQPRPKTPFRPAVRLGWRIDGRWRNGL